MTELKRQSGNIGQIEKINRTYSWLTYRGQWPELPLPCTYTIAQLEQLLRHSINGMLIKLR